MDTVQHHCLQRPAAWRRRGLLPLPFIRSRTVQIYEKLSIEALNPRLRQTAVTASGSVLRCTVHVAFSDFKVRLLVPKNGFFSVGNERLEKI